MRVRDRINVKRSTACQKNKPINATNGSFPMVSWNGVPEIIENWLQIIQIWNPRVWGSPIWETSCELTSGSSWWRNYRCLIIGETAQGNAIIQYFWFQGDNLILSQVAVVACLHPQFLSKHVWQVLIATDYHLLLSISLKTSPRPGPSTPGAPAVELLAGRAVSGWKYDRNRQFGGVDSAQCVGLWSLLNHYWYLLDHWEIPHANMAAQHGIFHHFAKATAESWPTSSNLSKGLAEKATCVAKLPQIGSSFDFRSPTDKLSSGKSFS